MADADDWEEDTGIINVRQELARKGLLEQLDSDIKDLVRRHLKKKGD